MTSGLRISCDNCVGQGTAACGDCVVTFLCERSPSGGVVVDAAEVQALRILQHAGLAPALRHERRAACG